MANYDPAKLDAFLRANYPDEIRPGGEIQIYNAGDGVATIVNWPTRLGKAPTVTQVKAFDFESAIKLDLGRKMLEQRELDARAKILRTKTRAAALLVAGGMSEPAAFAAGTEFVCDFIAPITAYERAGGNPIAGQRFIDAILAAPPEWWSEQMLALFQAELL